MTIRGGRLLQALALVAAFATLAVSVAGAARLVAYPFEWSPDDGWLLDDARSALDAPGTLHPRSLGPSPCPYTPLVPLLAAPLVAAGSEPSASWKIPPALTLVRCCCSAPTTAPGGSANRPSWRPASSVTSPFAECRAWRVCSTTSRAAAAA